MYISNIRVLVSCTSCLDNFDHMSAWSSTSTKRFLANNWIKIKLFSHFPDNLCLFDLLNYAATCYMFFLGSGETCIGTKKLKKVGDLKNCWN